MAVFPGSPNPDSLTGGVGDDLVDGAGGDDTLDGGTGGVDTLLGGAGNDLLRARADDSVDGGTGDDIIAVYEDGPGTLNGGAGIDILRFEGGYDITGTTLIGIEQLNAYGTVLMSAAQLASFSLVSGYSNAYTTAAVALTQGGTATVNLSATLTSYFSLTGSDQADIITFNPTYLHTIYAYAGAGNDRIITAAGNDSLRGDAGNDTLSSLGGDDTLDGGDGADTLQAGDGNDQLWVREGDSAYAGLGNDTLSVSGNLPAVLAGAGGTDTLRFESSYDISGAILSGIENLNLYGNDSMTAAQLDSFVLVQGYGPGYTSATVVLTEGGTAGVTLSALLSNGFTLHGSDDADLITFAPGYVSRIDVHGNMGNDSIVAAAGADYLRGGDGNDTLNGLGGNDTLEGGSGADQLIGLDGDDVLIGGNGDTLNGGVGNDLLSVTGSLSAVLAGAAGTDTLRFEGGYDISASTLSGVENLAAYGNDSMTALQLGSFVSVAGYSAAYTSATITLTQGGTATVRLAASLTDYFSLAGSAQDDLLTFAPAYTGRILVSAGQGNDSIVAAQGFDSLRGGDGDDTLSGLIGNDTLDGELGTDVLRGGVGDDHLYVRQGDSHFGEDGADLFSVYEGLPAVLNGGAGYDTLRFEGGYDITGATIVGIEQLNASGNVQMTAAQLGSFLLVSGYSAAYTTASVTLTQGGTAAIDLAATLSVSFTLTGSAQADILTFAATDVQQVIFNGRAGNDNVTAAQGNDSLRGEGGNDTLTGLGGNDTLDGGIGADLLYAGIGDDLLIVRSGDRAYGGANNDLLSVQESLPAILDGGTGIDTLRFESGYDITGATLLGIENLNAYGAVSMTTAQLDSFSLVAGYSPAYTSAQVQLTQGGTAAITLASSLTATFTLTGSSQNETLTFNAAHLGQIRVDAGYGDDNIAGASGGDLLRGDQGNDTLRGLNGNDTIHGGAGADRISGGNGIDVLTGGLGFDTFVFEAPGTSVAATPDRITDFQGAGVLKGDLFDLSAIDANGAAAGLGTFVFGSVAQGGLSLVDLGTDTLVRGNTDADAAFEFVFLIEDGAVVAATYTAADFLL